MLDQEIVGVGASMLQAGSIRFRSRRNGIFNAILGLSLAVLLLIGGLPLYAMTQEAHASSDQTVILPADKDSFLRSNAKNANEGASDVLRVQKTGTNRIVVSFDHDAIISAMGDRTLESAKLRLHIIDTGNNWGLGGKIEAHRLLVDWPEGNGWNVGNIDPFRGAVPGSTWNCAIDSAVWNYDADCSSLWAGGTYGEPVDFVTITNNLSGIIEFDVTGDVKDFLSNGSNFGWLIKKTDEYQSGTVIFGSKENGAINGPELVLETTAVEPEASLISDVAIDPAVNDTSVVIEADSNVSTDLVTQSNESTPVESDPVAILPEAETGSVIEQMSNSTVIEPAPPEQTNSTLAQLELGVTQSNSTTTEPISLLEPVTLPEPVSSSNKTEVNQVLSDIITEDSYPTELTNSTIHTVTESNVMISDSTATEIIIPPAQANATAVLPEPIAPLEDTYSTMEVTSVNSLPVETSEGAEAKSLLAPVADLAITEDNEFDSVIAGEMYLYDITVTNHGPSDATNVVVTDILPSGVTFTALSSSQGTCSQTDNIVTCVLGTIPADSSATIAIVVTANSDVHAGSLTNSANVTTDTADLNQDNNSLTRTINVTTQSDLSIMVEGSSQPVAAGQELTYNITVTNDGPSDATNVVAIDALPSGAILSTTTSSQGTCSLTDNVVTCSLGAIATDSSATITIVATVNPDVPADSMTSAASVTSDTDRYAGSDTGSDALRYAGPDADNNSRKIVPVKMTKTENGLSASVDFGDIDADQKAEFLLLNNTLPDAQLKTIEITPASNVTNASLNITVSNDVPYDIPLPDIDDTLLFFEVSLDASGVDFGNENTYSKSPEITFTVDKNEDGTCKDVELFILNEETGEWETESLIVTEIIDLGSQCEYTASVPHFSTFMIGLKKPTGGGGVGSGGSGGGGGPAVMGVENPKTVYNYSDNDDDAVVGQARSAVQYKFATSAVGGVDSKNDIMEVSTINGKGVISTYTDTIVIKNKSNSTLQSVRVTLSPEISKSFHLDKYAIKSIDPNSEVTLGIKLRGNPNKDTDGRVTGFSGSVIVQAANHSPLVLPVKINSLDNSYYQVNMEKVAQISQQRYNKISLVNKILNNGVTEKSDIEVTTRQGLREIGTPSDQIVIKNLSDRTLNNVRVMISKASNAFILDTYSVPQIAPNGEAVLQMISRLDMNKYTPTDFKAEIIIAPENGVPTTISVNIPAVERENSSNEYEVTTVSENNELTKAVDRITIRNIANRTMDSVKLMLPSGLDRILQLSEDSFKTIESNETVAVDLTFRSTIGEKKEAFMQDYKGELTIVSEHHNKKTIPLRIEWNEVSSEHFTVYARTGEEYIAEQVIDLLESNYQPIASRFGEMNTKTIIYMASSMDEMQLINTSGHPYYSYSDDAIFVCSCDDPKFSSLKEFVYRLIVNNYPSYHNMKKLTHDKENWLVDGIAGYTAANVIEGISEKYLETFASDRADLQWYGYGTSSQYGAVFAFLDFLETKYGDIVINKSLEHLGSTMISNHRCSTLEQCAVLRAAYDASSLDINDKKHSLAFDTLVKEWSSLMDQNNTDLPSTHAVLDEPDI